LRCSWGEDQQARCRWLDVTLYGFGRFGACLSSDLSVVVAGTGLAHQLA
jgi:hypothetical protein